MERIPPSFTVKELAIASIFSSGFLGGVVGLFQGPRNGFEIAMGLNGLLTGAAFGIESFNAADELIRKKEITQASRTTMAGSLLTTLSLTISGTSFGALAGTDRIVTGAIVGASIGGALSLIVSSYSIIRAIRDPNI